jgi:acyl-CoA thioesterase-1
MGQLLEPLIPFNIGHINNLGVRSLLNVNASISWFILPTFVAGMVVSFACDATSISQTLQAENPIRIMPLGDSITQANSKHNSYRRPLWIQLQYAGYKVDFVGSSRENFQGPPPLSDFDQDHEGHWGWRVDQILEQIDNWTRTSRPDIVLIHLGTNDLNQGQSQESTIGELRQLILILRKNNPRVKLLLAQLIPCGNKARIQQFNRLIVNLARETNTLDSPVIVVDQFTGFNATKGSDTYDGCHPSKAGEKKMANRWFAALKKVLPNP